MKRALSAILAMLMILSCMVILPTFAAEEASGEKKVFLSNCDSFDGWPGFEGKGGTVDTANKTEGAASISVDVQGKSTSGAGRFAYEWSKGQYVDTTGMNRVVFDLYVSDVAFLDTKFELELRSEHNGSFGGWTDAHELHVSGNPLKTFIIGTPKTGWNRIEIPFSSFGQAGTVNRDKIAYMRMFLPSNTNNSFGVDGKTYTLKLDNFHFTDRTTAYEPVDGFDIVVADGESTNGWKDCADEGLPALALKQMGAHGGVISITYTGKMHGNGGWSNSAGNGVRPTNGIKTQLTVPAVNATGMNYFCFWLYVSDPAPLKDKKFFFELTSHTTTDHAEICVKTTFDDLKGSALTKGWNYFSVPLTKFTSRTDGTKGPFDISKFQTFRFYNETAFDLGSSKLTLALDTVGFSKTQYDTPVFEDDYVPVPASLISVIDGETLDGFATGDKLVLDYTNPYQGNSSIARTITGVDSSVAGIKYEYTMPNGKTYDATEIQRLVFDMYLSSAAAFETAQFELELRGVGDGDTTELNTVASLADLKGDVLVDGWNHFDIPLSKLNNRDKANMAEFNYFRIFLRGDQGVAGIEGEDSTIKLDNVYMTADPVVYEDRIPLAISVKNGNATANKLVASAGTDYWHIEFLGYKTNPVDIKEMTWIEFDVYIGNAELNKSKFRFDITSSGTCDQQQITMNGLTLSQMAGGDVPAGEWTHVMLPIHAFRDANNSGGTFDASKANFIRFFSVGGSSSTDSTAYEFQVRNFAITKDMSTETEFYIWDAESKAQYEGGTTSDITAERGVGFGDVDGDGDNEYIMRNFAADNATKKIGTGNEQILLKFANHLRNVGFADFKALRFDMYVSNEKYLDASLNVEFTSGDNCDRGEISGVLKMRNHIVEDKGNGWYTIEIKVSSLGSSTPGGYTPFMPARFNFLRMYTASVIEWGADEDLVVAVDNFYLLREGYVVEDEDAFQIPAGAVTLPITTKTLMSLAPGGSYTSVGQVQQVQGFTATDISGQNLLFAELELKGYEAFADTVYCIELTSSGKCDVNEYSASMPLRALFTRVDGMSLEDGKQWVYADLNSSYWKHVGGKADFTAINYIRIFNQTKNISVNVASSAVLTNFFVTNEEIMNLPAPTSVDFTGVSLNLNESLTMTFAANIHPSLSNVTMMVNFDGKDIQLTGERVGVTNKVLFTFDGIMPYQMADVLSASLMAMTPDGKLLTDSIDNYSVKQYCINLLNSLKDGALLDETGKLEAFLVEVLYYGSAVQYYMDYNTNNLPAEDEAVDLALRNQFYAPAKQAGLIGEQGDCPVEFTTATAVLGNSYVLRINMKADSMSGVNVLVNGEAAKVVEGETKGTYYVDIPVSAFSIDDSYAITIEGYDNYSLNYSFGMYVLERMAELDEDDAEYILLDAIVAYCTASRAYVVANH